MRIARTILIGLLLCLTACGEYQQVLKSKDPERKYQYALTLFDGKEYVKAQSLFDEVASFYKGTERSEDILAYLGRCYMGQKVYSTAAEYYQSYIRNYPKGRYITEARFQVGHCNYLDSPDARLDQQITRTAIQAFAEFVDLYPDNPYAPQAWTEMNELMDKLAYKEYLSAKLYFNLGSYLGNNYLSAELVAKNALKQYPSNKYQEELNWLILQSKYEQVLHSFEDKKYERAVDAEDESYSFMTEFPDSKHVAAAQRICKEMKKITQNKFQQND